MSILEEINNKDTERAFKAPEKTVVPAGYKTIFLAGSIEMNKAKKWQDSTTKTLLEDFEKLIVYNPRRDDWDSSWKQELYEDGKFSQFYHQVDWEINHILESDFVLIYFQEDTQSPISLLELGLVAAEHRSTNLEAVVCCPEGFWRKGNVDYMCKEFGIDTIESLDGLSDWLKSKGIK